MLSLITPRTVQGQTTIELPTSQRDGGSTRDTIAPAIDQPSTRPEAAGRVVAYFDFEEQTSNPLPVPQGWIRAQHDPLVPRNRPGFAPWNQAELDYTAPAVSGTGTLRIPTRGDSGSLQLRSGEIPVFESADYLIGALVRAEGLEHARPAIVARLLDRDGTPILGAEVRAEVDAGSSWTPVAVSIRGGYEGAVFLQLELLLLQPDQQQRPGPQDYVIWRHDVSGNVWFDEVRVIQMPRVELSTGSPINIHASSSAPELTLNVRDLTGEPLTADVVVYDVNGVICNQEQWRFGRGRAIRAWQPELPGFGWYRGAVTLRGPDGVIGGTSVDFLWVPEHDREELSVLRGTDGLRFGVDAGPIALEAGRATADLLADLGSKLVVFPAWTNDLQPETMEAHLERLATVVDAVSFEGADTVLELPRLPQGLADTLRTEPDQVADAFTAERTSWGPYIDPILDQFGQSIRRWRLGTDSGSHRGTVAERTDLLDPAGRGMAFLVPLPVITVPWNAAAIPDAPLPDVRTHSYAWLTRIEPGTGPEQIRRVASEFIDLTNRSEGAGQDDWATIQIGLDNPDRMGRHAAATGFAARAIELWGAITSDQRGRSVRLVADSLWASAPSPATHGTVHPRAEHLVWRTLIDKLSERVLVGEYEPAPGVRALVFGPSQLSNSDRGGLVVLLPDLQQPNPSDRPRSVVARFGDGRLLASDIYGRSTPIDPVVSQDQARIVHTIPIGDDPLLIEGVDTALLQLMASVRLDEPVIESRPGLQERSILFTNPWAVPLRGRAFLVEPSAFTGTDRLASNWRIGPRILPFIVEPGATGRLPFTLSFPSTQLSGDIDFVVDFEMQSNRDYGWARARTTARVEADGLEVLLTHRFVDSQTPGLRDVIVEAVVVNNADEPVSAEITASIDLAGVRRASVSELAPGSEMVRTFGFQNAEALLGGTVFVSVLDQRRGVRLNRTLLLR
jgi:hypothetical protein